MSEVKLDETGLTTPSISLGGNTLSSEGDKLLWNGEEFKSGVGGHSVGEQWVSMDGTIPLGGVPFNGQILNIADYQDLYNWARDNSKIKSESEWQTLKTNNNSNVTCYSQYSDTQFRMPIFRGYLKASSNGGNYAKEGLPNIWGQAPAYFWSSKNSGTSGVLSYNSNANAALNGGATENFRHGTITLDASRASSIYGNSTHVTPETNSILVGVYAFNTVTNAAILDATNEITSNINLSIAKQFFDIGYPYADSSGGLLALRSVNYTDNPGGFELFAKDATKQMVLGGRTDGTLTWDGKPIIRLVESWRSGTSWYRKYSDGWIEQGGSFSFSDQVGTITLHKAFSNVNYFAVVSPATGGSSPNYNAALYSKTTTSFVFNSMIAKACSGFWYACGY